MSFRSVLAAITSLCIGLIAASVAIADECAGLFIPHTGMQFTTAFTNDFGRDADSLTTVTTFPL
jgi:hypothetical protein